MARKLNFDEIFSNRPSVETLKKMARMPISAMIENIRSMHNVGSIFRTSDGIRLEKLYLSGYTPHPPRPEINKTALGSTDSVPWIYAKNPLDQLKELKEQGYTIYVLEQTTESRDYASVDYKFPLCLIVGNEVDGVSEELLSMADHSIEIPMLGIKHSLNVSVAFGIIAYHMLSKCK